MHTKVYKEYEQILSRMNIHGSVLEVGATPDKKSLLCMKQLKNAKEKVGINLIGPYKFMDFKIHKGNANSMDFFEDERFDLVLCNALIEHDKYFWKTIAEIKRVTKSGGMIVIGCPGYRYYKFEKLQWALNKLPLIRSLKNNKYLNAFFTATLTFKVHSAPGDYYRFSPEAFKDVLFEDLDKVEIRSIMLPPRIIGIGIKR